MKVVGFIALFLAGLVSGYLLHSLGVVDAIDGLPGAQEEPSLSLPTYLGFISVMMTSVTVVLAAVAIGIGLVAAYTFREIKAEARSMAHTTVQKEAEQALSDDAIKARIDEVAFGSMRPSPIDQDKDYNSNDGNEI